MKMLRGQEKQEILNFFKINLLLVSKLSFIIFAHKSFYKQSYLKIIMRILKVARKFSSNSLTRFQHFTTLQAEQLLLEPNPLRDSINQHLDHNPQFKLQSYWNLALTHPQFGYYSQKNVFAKEGDFVTSPEISPLFGEMIGIWLMNFLFQTKILNPITNSVEKKFRIVELGGGRGLLMKDILRSLQDLKINNYFDINFVQVSEYNRKCQQETVLQQFKKHDQFFRFQHEKSTKNYESFQSQNEFKDIKLCWFTSAEEILREDIENAKNGQQPPFTVFIMNQYFDALPTSILQFTEKGWREQVIVKSKNPNLFFDLAVSSNPLPEKMTPDIPEAKIGDTFEISPQSLLQIDMMSKIVNSNGGCILNVDYGEQGSFNDSIRAIKDHKYVPAPYFWQIPGLCDLSSYVNFSALKQFAQVNKGIKAFDVLPQGYFLEAMGIVPRVDILKKGADQEVGERLENEYKRLVLQTEMGQIYKVQIITKKEYGEIYPHITEETHSY